MRFKLHWAPLLDPAQGFPKRGKQENWKKSTAAGAIELTWGSAEMLLTELFLAARALPTLPVSCAPTPF